MNTINAVLILAGGQSSRMGSPKALLTLPNGQSLLDFHIDNAKSLNLPILIADNNKGYYTANQQDIKVIDDYLPSDEFGKGQGALSAIVSALQFINKKGYVLVIGCDTLLNIDLIAKTLSSTTADVGYLMGQKEYPLLGVYHSRVLATLIDFLNTGNRSVMQFLNLVDCQTFNLDNHWHSLANFNTQDEFNQALQKTTNEFNTFRR